MALCGSRDARFRGDRARSYQMLYECRAGAYLGMEYGLSELITYFKELFEIIYSFPYPYDDLRQFWAETVKAILDDGAIDLLAKMWDLSTGGFNYKISESKLAPIITEISSRHELLDCLLPSAAFEDGAKEKSWLEEQFDECAKIHGSANATTIRYAERLGSLLVSSDDPIEASKQRLS
ncbi:hypothetical protein EPUS_08424 [Endocarpon pusillum Z07020]|uniref:Uncharacterized protein n=1 Tax=Endocarpon pusillum (strain Z07020 / HMAS-L-300199) TaxID=1263415 RepID=U1HNS5_ENDPU|nr:uncharacterized protein EPUS_08424 [Endocarpon pusillum Z07020]ERF72030.1 hypothetical protein EPUS_08424 [Endocarpon pusillum Z07020]